jgi:hypothetical protein
MITKKEFEAAMLIVNQYCSQQLKIALEKSESLKVNEIGCRVKLSEWGILQKRNKKSINLTGTVIQYRQWMHYKNDGIATVKWDTIEKPQSFHISHLEILKS